MADDQGDGVEDAVAALHAFWVARFEHETRWFHEWKKSRNDPGADTTRIYALAEQELVEIYTRHCTPKKRVYTTGGSLSDDPLYNPTQETVDSAERESSNRVVVCTSKTTFRTSTPLFRHRYVMIRRAGTWLVDNVQWTHPITGNWTRRPL